jgi:hypothetical protein
MNAFLAHIDLMPLFYGVVMFFGLAYMWQKLLNGQVISVGMDMFVFWLVFSLHGGTMAGGFSAMICAALSSMFFPWMYNRRMK